VNVLAVEDLLARLDDQRLLGTDSPMVEPRQRTLGTTIEWSHNLLSDADQQLFRRLAVFAGGWSVGAAEDVAYGDVDALGRISNQSLIAVDERDGQARHRFLETIRAYASERLQQSDEGQDLHARRAAFFGELASEAGEGMLVRAPGVCVRRLEDELDNLRAALTWLSAANPPAAVEMAAGCGGSGSGAGCGTSAGAGSKR
jgi:predicted ATPase